MRHDNEELEAWLEDLRGAMESARTAEMEARVAGDRTVELRSRMLYHSLRETYDDEVGLSSNRMLRDYVEGEAMKRWRRQVRKQRRGSKDASDP